MPRRVVAAHLEAVAQISPGGRRGRPHGEGKGIQAWLVVQLGVIESYKDKLYFIEYGRRAASLPAANDLVIRHCGKRRKVNDLADHNQFPMRLFGNNVDAKRGSWALLKSQPKPTLAAQQPAQSGKRKAAR